MHLVLGASGGNKKKYDKEKKNIKRKEEQDKREDDEIRIKEGEERRLMGCFLFGILPCVR